jgi:hypothetical protein
LILELLHNVQWPRELDPGFGEEHTGGQHEGDVECSVGRVKDGFLDGMGWQHVIQDAQGGCKLGKSSIGYNEQ